MKTSTQKINSLQIGAFLAPVISIPFLGTNENDNSTKGVLIFNNTDFDLMDDGTNNSKITILYPLVGLSTILMSLGYLFMAIHNYKKKQSIFEVQSNEKNEDHAKQKLNVKHWILLIIMIAFYFFYAGAEVLYGTYLTIFSVKSLLKLSKQVGSQITATFWGCFAAMRFVSIFTAIFLKPIYVMFVTCLISCIGIVLLVVYGNHSIIILWVGSAMLGLGMASVYATGLLWLESFIRITNRIGT